MKKTLWILACALCSQFTFAQAPKWAEKARKAVFSIVTYDKDNNIKGTGNGFYIDNQGTALSDYTLFEGAERAIVINADGKQVEEGTPEEIFDHPKSDRLQHFLAKVL